MPVLLVTYDIKDDQNRRKVSAVIERRYPKQVKLSDSCYAIHTALLPVRIFDELKPFVEVEDQLYVAQLNKPYTGFGPRKTTGWLSDYLPVA